MTKKTKKKLTIAEARKKPGGSNVGKKKFANGQKRTGPYAGPGGGAPAGSFPIPDLKHAKAALALAHNAPNPKGIKAKVYKKYPRLKKHASGGPVLPESGTVKRSLVIVPGKNKAYDDSLKVNNGWMGSLSKAASLEDVYNTNIGTWGGNPLTYKGLVDLGKYVGDYYNTDFVTAGQKKRLGLPNEFDKLNNQVSPGRTSSNVNDQYMPRTAIKAAGNDVAYSTYALGGSVNAEIEKQEVVIPPNGIQSGIRRKYNLPTHKNATGENMISAQPGSFVVSDRLMYDDTRTMAQAYEDAGKKSDKYRKILDNPKSTSLAIKTSQRNLDNIKRLQEDIVAKNQAMLARRQGSKGPVPKAFAGMAVGTIASLIPAAANIIGGLGKADKLNPNEFMNPYGNLAISDMANRRFNTGPALAANANAAAAAMGNVANLGGGRGQVNANRQALLGSRMMADSSVYAQAQNANNQYLGEKAQMEAGIGQQMASTRLQVRDINDRNKAAKQNMLMTGLGQVGQAGQTLGLMLNQKERDDEMMKRWQDYMNMLQTGKSPRPADVGQVDNTQIGFPSWAFANQDPYSNQMAGRNLNNY